MPITRRSLPTFQLTNTTSITVKRPGATTIVNGRKKAGTLTTHTIQGNYQPLKFNELMVLPEADRTKEWFKIYCDINQNIRTAKEGSSGWEADVVTINGFDYRVMSVRKYQMGILDHIHVLVARTPISAVGV